MLIDSHAHLNFEDFANDWQTVIADCQKKGVWLINVGSQLGTSRKAIAIANQYEKGVYAACGLHPIHVSGSTFHPEAFNIDEYRSLIKSSKKVVALGETGLDFFHSDKNIENQKKVFAKHLNLAQEFGLPVIVHARNSQDGRKDAYEEILKVLRAPSSELRAQGTELKGVIHCFGGTLEQAKAFLDLGFYIGFTGVITFPKTENLAVVVKSLPLNKILVETDSPYLAPSPYRGQRNRPEYVELVAREIAKIRGLEYNEIENQTFKNAIKLFTPLEI
ncbi:MAG: TatD family hydrolase [Patescibacteria group bacterium]|jgi:TatD DNase family protein